MRPSSCKYSRNASYTLSPQLPSDLSSLSFLALCQTPAEILTYRRLSTRRHRRRPVHPGFVADGDLAAELAEIGVILLMFGVSLHFSYKDLFAVRNIAIPGAIAQITVATLMGMGLAWLLDWPLASGLVFGLALSVASTVVLLRALEERQLVDTRSGHVAIGWLIVEDIAMIFALVLLPVVAQVLPGVDGAPLTAVGADAHAAPDAGGGAPLGVARAHAWQGCRFRRPYLHRR